MNFWGYIIITVYLPKGTLPKDILKEEPSRGI